jgi:cobalt/nickel transport system permease protein
LHIPDGFIAPLTYLPAYVIAAGAWTWAGRDLRRRLDEQTIPRLAVVTALAYTLGLVMVPLPGGTSGHVVGVAMLALLFGVRTAFLAYSLVLLLQALMFGAGGITALPINALAIGLVGGTCALVGFKLLRGWSVAAGVVFGTLLSVLIPALIIALVLGAQPLLAQREDGTPLFFPFGWKLTVPALLLPHFLTAAGEALLTLMVWRYAETRGWTS